MLQNQASWIALEGYDQLRRAAPCVIFRVDHAAIILFPILVEVHNERDEVRTLAGGHWTVLQLCL